MGNFSIFANVGTVTINGGHFVNSLPGGERLSRPVVLVQIRQPMTMRQRVYRALRLFTFKEV